MSSSIATLLVATSSRFAVTSAFSSRSVVPKVARVSLLLVLQYKLCGILVYVMCLLIHQYL